MFGRNGKNICCPIKKPDDILNTIKSKGFLASSLSIYDFSTLNNIPSHNSIKEKLTELIEQYFNREDSLYLACHEKRTFFILVQSKRYNMWPCQKVSDALCYLLDNIFIIRYGSKLYIDKF